MDHLETLERNQHQLLTRTQILQCGRTDEWIDWKLRSGRWRTLLPGIYLTVPVEPTWTQFAAAGCLYAGSGACLGPQASLFVNRVTTTPPRPVDIWVPHRRKVAAQPGLIVVRRRGAYPVLLGSMPRLRVVDATAARITQLDRPGDVLALLAQAARHGAPPDWVAQTVTGFRRVPNRALLTKLLTDSSAGVESALEHEYRYQVERAHRLPASQLQRRERMGPLWIRSDVAYRGLGVRCELDGRLAHPGGRTDDDCWRDNEVVLTHGDITLRYRWSHALTPCRTAAQVARALADRGWTGQLVRCGPSCAFTIR